MRSLTGAVVAVEQVGGDDLEVVVGGVGEGAAAVAVAQRPDAGHVGAQLRRRPRCSRARRWRRRPSRARDRRCSAAGRRPAARAMPTTLGAPSRAVDARPRRRRRAARSGCTRRRCARRCPRASRMSRIASETSSSSRRDQARALLDDGDLGAEAAVHLRELEPDVAAADDHQVARQRVEREHRRVGEVRARRRCRAGRARSARPPTLMKMRGAVSSSSPTRTRVGPLEARVALE